MKYIPLRSRLLGVPVLFALLTGSICLQAQSTVPAALVSVNAITDTSTIGVWFGAPVDPQTATNPANYTVLFKTNSPNVVSVDLNADSSVAYLNLDTKVEEFFSVSVSNVLDGFGQVINDFTLGYISDFKSTDIGNAADPNPPGTAVSAHPDSFDVTTGGSDIGGTDDFFHFISQPVIGNFDVSVNLTRLDQADAESKAGLMARENFSTGSRTLQIFSTPTGGLNQIEVSVRASTNGTASDQNFQIAQRPPAAGNSWLRLTRTNNTFTAFYGTNGQNWFVTGIATQSFAATLNLGLCVAAHSTNGEATTASFSDFQFKCTRPGDGTRPQLGAAKIGTNLVLTWQRTPRDFAVQVTTNLAKSTNWNFLLLPILQNLTNAAARSMLVPAALIDKPLFFRLARVERVIPDPPLILFTGIILSPGLGLNSTVAAGSLCTTTPALCYPILASYAQAQTGGQVIAPKGTPVTFTTADSDVSADTVLQVRNVTGMTIADDNSAGAYKSKVVETTIAANMTNAFSMVIAPRSAPAAGYPGTGVLRVKIIY